MRPDDWHLTHDLDAFLDRAGDFLASRPDLHTVPLTVLNGLRRRGLHMFGGGAPLFGALETRDGEVGAVFFRTPPHWINVTPLTEEQADALAARLASAGHRLPGISAESATAAAFATAWRRHAGPEPRLRRCERLYRLDRLTVPAPAPEGAPRVATAADRDRLVRWFEEFGESIGEGNRQDGGGWADSRIAYGGITFWESADGTPVSMAGVTPEVAGQIRVAPVFTPAGLRGRGYAGAATAEVSRAARATGAEVLLFTDLANPTSNGLYQRIGYRPVADFAVYEFTAPTERAAASSR
ncbi:GNAT family N-acetyltransferase [Streptomyces rishiriensis]|uniref:GNAT superfamily N-acetyltransferase n=1 Tax=Streptomyces rishiriensis TaxID=68264 RepID=A0ABU0NRC2_STRRH|nr:GNAT family N-acetyltransferase [Streptomyces rishiriensis]MDQ0581706.1 GNAT superfamily N-acetyltransferase [Streptomyces rishiriensis]